MISKAARIVSTSVSFVVLLLYVPVALPEPLVQSQILRGDFNGDGRPDALTQPASIGRDVELRLGELDGSLGAPTFWSSKSLGFDWSVGASRIATGDFNGDGRPEYFLQAREDGVLSALIIAGTDGRPTGVSQHIQADLIGWEWTANRVVPIPGDFDGNGRDEAVLQSTDEFGVHYVMTTSESGQFAHHGQGWLEDHLALRWTAPATRLHSGDFNGDGRDDLLIQPMDAPRIGHPKDALYALVLADERGQFHEVFATWDRDAFGADWDPLTHELVVRDVDGDRIADVWLRAYSTSGTNFLIVGRSSGRFDTADFKWTGNDSPETVYARERAGTSSIVVDSPIATNDTADFNALEGLESTSTQMMSNQPAPLDATDPGSLGGEFSVDPTGAANYQVRIDVPPGVAGMQPSLAFLYNSRAGVGHLGVGWSISGLSAITRCPQTIDQDGLPTMRGITLTQEDRFCLDGQRLMVKPGQTYGANGSQYHTEIASFQRAVASVTSASNGPDSFEVRDRAGLVRTYGMAFGIDARIEAAPSRPQAMLWAINRISDRNGNYIQFNYVEDGINGEYRPSTIAYFNRNNTQIGRVEFGYENRPDVRIGYSVTGAKLSLTQRLQEVRTYDGSTLVSSYRLLYGTSSKSGLSQLASIQRCNVAIGSGGARCLPASTFEWQDGQRGFAPGPIWKTLGATIANVKAVDVNGNGSMELVFQDNGYWRMSTGKAYSTGVTNTGISTADSNNSYALAIDVNADGYQDFAIPHTSSHALSSKWGFYQSNGTALNPTPSFSVPHEGAHDKKPVVIDLDGDVYPELVFKKNQQLWAYRNVGGQFSVANSVALVTAAPVLGDQDVTAIEWDGDGRPDLFINGRNCQSNNNCWNNVGVWRNNGNLNFTKIAGTELKKPIIGDFNGDGLTDFADIETSVLKVYENTGGSWSLAVTTQTSNFGDSAQVIDYNQDGRQDILVPRGDDYWHAYFWDETSRTFVDENTGTPIVDRPSSRMLDFDGNGKPDILYLDIGDGWKVRAQFQTMSGMVIGFVDGDQGTNGVKGIRATATYASLAHFYGGNRADGMGATGVVAPRTRHFNGPMPVVRFSTLSSGTSAPTFTSYTYSGGKLNQFGRGFLGFREIKANNAGTGIFTTNTMRQDFPFAGMIESASQDTPPSYRRLYTESEVDTARSDQADLCLFDWETKLCQYPAATSTTEMIQVVPGVKVSSSVIVLNSMQLGEGHFPYVDSSTTDTFEVNGGALLRREATDFEYADGWGNPTRIVLTTSDGNGGDVHVTTTENTYTNDAVAWILARLTQATVTTSIPGNGASVGTRRSSFSYAGPGQSGEGQLTSETVEAGGPLEMSKVYAFDAYGNRVSMTVSGSGVVPRQSSYAYDGNGRFVLSQTGPTGFMTQQTWDGRFGALASITDANGNTVASTFDLFGRTILETGPRPGVTRSTSRTLCGASGCFAASRGARWKSTTTDSAGQSHSIEFDMFGRELLSRTLDWKPDSPRYINVEKTYDERGRLEFSTAPYFDGDARCWSQVVYDAKDRVIQARAPASIAQCAVGGVGSAPPAGLSLGRVVTTDYSVDSTLGYRALLSRRTDPTMTRTISTWMNSAGRQVRVSEVNESNQTISTSFQFDEWGNTKAVIDPNGVSRTVSYNARGFKLTSTDPDMGVWQYQYNAFGELTQQVDAKGQSATMTYDLLGRLASRTEPEGTTTWTYDSATTCLQDDGSSTPCTTRGLIASVTGPGPADTGGVVSESYAYDRFGALRQTLRTIDGKAFWTTFKFDSEGRVERVRYPDIDSFTSSGADVLNRPTGSYEFWVRNHYSNGALHKVTDPSGNTNYWKLNETKAWGAASVEEFGNGVLTTTTFDASLQLPSMISAALPGGPTRTQTYIWSLSGNLTRRVDNWSNHAEDFIYDKQHRLKQVTLDDGFSTGPVTITNSYDAVGRLQSRYASAMSQVAVTDYAYADPGHKHAVTTASFGGSPQAYAYDANGNATAARGMPIAWTSFNMPYAVGDTSGSAWSRFAYGPNRNRWRQSSQSPVTGQATIYYVGALFEREERGIAQLFRYHIFANGKAVAYHTWLAGVGTTNYLHRDHIGSVIGVSSSTGAMREDYGYDAWGKRRPAATWSSLSAGSFIASTNLTESDGFRRGFTGHEMLDHLGLIHMNGRIYDPEIARFISADPFVQFPSSTQGYDRYQYVNNNPLSASDPSGYFIDSVYESTVMNATYQGAEQGGMRGAINGFMWSSAINGIGILLQVGIQGIPPSPGMVVGGTMTTVIARGVASGIVGGALSEIGGGRFGDGYLGSSASSMLNSAFGQSVQNVFVSALIGGTASELGGGKFANGAISAAFTFTIQTAADNADNQSLTGADAKYSRLSNGVNDDPAFQGTDGLWRIDTFSYRNGLFGALFTNGLDFVLVYRGTNPFSPMDWLANLQQLFFLGSSQHTAAIDLAFRLQEKYGTVHFVGHSLGGGLAAVSAAAIKSSATVFNSAGIRSTTYGRYNPANANIRAYSSAFDIVQFLNVLTMASVPGQQISLGYAGFHSISGISQRAGQ